MVPRMYGRLLLISAAMVLAASACGNTAASGDLDKVQIEISRFDVTITNTSGRGLLEVRVAILPVGRATSYSVHAGRLENAEKRSLSFDRFTDKDAIPFSPRRVKASVVAVTANDIDGTKIAAEVPWKQ